MVDPGAEARDKWDRIYGAADPETLPEPARVLMENAHLLPRAGTALDLASGLGGNALCLARQGLTTRAFDLSTEAIARLKAWADRWNLSINAEVRDVVLDPPPKAAFDVVVVSRFLERSLTDAITGALRPGGLLYYQTYTLEKATPAGPANPDYLLAPGELLTLFAGLRPVVYREEGLLGDLTRGFRNQALLVARKI